MFAVLLSLSLTRVLLEFPLNAVNLRHLGALTVELGARAPASAPDHAYRKSSVAVSDSTAASVECRPARSSSATVRVACR
jgi:hypothetical protein